MARSRKFRSSIAATAALVIVVALAGCSATAHDTSPARVSDLVVSSSGLTGLDVGNPVGASDLVRFGKHACPSSGGWTPRYARNTNNSSGQPLSPFDVNTKGASRNGAVTAIFVWSRAIKTARGIHVGSSLASVEAAYPSATTKKAYSTVLYVVAGSHGKLVIELAGHNDDAAGEWPAKQLDTVVWMDVIPRGAEVESIAGSDDAGPCPVKGHVPDTDDGDDDD